MARTQQQNVPAQQARPQVGYREIKDLLVKHEKEFAKVLPAHIPASKLIGVASNIVAQNPGLQECTPRSVLSAVHRAASLGLDLGKGFNEAFLIPRWDKQLGQTICNFQIGYGGLVKLALQSGEIVYVRALEYCEKDLFRYRWTPRLDFVHEPYLGVGGAGKVLKMYAHATFKNGEDLVEVMDVEEVNLIRDRAKDQMRKKDGSFRQSPWDTDWRQMARKTALRRICKLLPRSTDLDDAIYEDERIYPGESDIVVSGPEGRPYRRAVGRGLAALADQSTRHEAGDPYEEPEFSPGVDKPIYSEPPDDLPSERMPGED